jgi:hypothetical protein
MQTKHILPLKYTPNLPSLFIYFVGWGSNQTSALCMLGKYSTTEIHLQIQNLYL